MSEGKHWQGRCRRCHKRFFWLKDTSLSFAQDIAQARCPNCNRVLARTTNMTEDERVEVERDKLGLKTTEPT